MRIASLTGSLLAGSLTLLAADGAAQTCLQLGNSPPGTDLQLAENEARVLALPFAFPFDGQSYDQVTVCSNGFVWLGAAASAPSTASEASWLSDPARVALLWDDWAPQLAAPGDGVFFAADASQAAIVFRGVPAAVGAGLLHGEIVLAASGEIALHFDVATVPQAGLGITGITPGDTENANPLDLSLLPPITLATGYELFDPANPLDLAGLTTALTPTGVQDYTLGNPTPAACPPGTWPPLATAAPYGAGCPPAGQTGGAIYEVFDTGAVDLTGLSLRFSATGVGSYDVTPGAGLDPGYAPGDAVAIGDDDQVHLPLQFAFPFEQRTVAAVDVCSNGYLWLEPSPSTDFSPTAQEFVTLQPRIAVLWTDLQPDAAGTVYLTSAADHAMITWVDVPYWNSSDLVTCQVKLFDTGDVELNYGAVATNPFGVLAGLSAGAGTVNPGGTDLSSLSGPASILRPTPPLLHVTGAPPVLGRGYPLIAQQIDQPGTAIVAFVIGFQQLQNDLTPLGMPGCFEYAATNATLLNVLAGETSTQALLPIPPFAFFLGTQLYTQAAAFSPGLTPLGVVSSNGVAGVLGI